MRTESFSVILILCAAEIARGSHRHEEEATTGAK
jgi:hypothetical protein